MRRADPSVLRGRQGLYQGVRRARPGRPAAASAAATGQGQGEAQTESATASTKPKPQTGPVGAATQANNAVRDEPARAGDGILGRVQGCLGPRKRGGAGIERDI